MEQDVEIMTGNGIENAFLAFGIIAIRRYRCCNPETGTVLFEVWELSRADLDRLLEIPDQDWDSHWGWFRWAKGSNMGTVNAEYTIHGSKIMAWRTTYPDYPEHECAVINPNEYKNLLEYFSLELGASTESNICALSIDLAKQNGIKLSELCERYIG